MGCQEGDGTGGQQVAGSFAGNAQNNADQTVFRVVAWLADGGDCQLGELGADEPQGETGVPDGMFHAHVNSLRGLIFAAGKGQFVAAFKNAGRGQVCLPVVCTGWIHLKDC